MLDGRWRASFEKGLKPIGANIRRAGLKADHLTLLGIVFAAGSAVAIGADAMRGALVLLALSGACDALDGTVAKAWGSSGPRGAFFDSVSDRFTDALLFGGVAWYLSDAEGGKVVLLPMAVLGAAMLVSYERAKADALGFDARGGVMERAERFLVLGVGLFFQILVPVLWVMLAASLFTAGQRFHKVWVQASGPVPAPAAARQRRRPRRSTAITRRAAAERWRERRSRRHLH